ncbi:uncharacterized protein EI90DRAFT_3083654 [Cantharellus anzutake]|uniref:uncharacterized protein n=1 Tax=Cantharellus anzutake TaxID=1750568 RepID=UPI001907C80A|nr:uncharacterized protein EI90DRAFT_3083654 [Cantharellus anzutake]KAF8318335.1 hypothetical protein EI90DRAFT_3083654 [Cantharellus anzutake]
MRSTTDRRFNGSFCGRTWIKPTYFVSSTTIRHSHLFLPDTVTLKLTYASRSANFGHRSRYLKSTVQTKRPLVSLLTVACEPSLVLALPFPRALAAFGTPLIVSMEDLRSLLLVSAHIQHIPPSHDVYHFPSCYFTHSTSSWALTLTRSFCGHCYRRRVQSTPPMPTPCITHICHPPPSSESTPQIFITSEHRPCSLLVRKSSLFTHLHVTS